jgi:hypothetical protein
MNQQIIDLTADEVVPPRRSMRLAAIIPASYWISIGYSQAQATAMEELQNDIDNYYDVDGGETDIILQRPGSLIRIDQIIPHHELLLPHWDKFANELRGRDSVTRVRLRGISLPLPALDILFQALQSMNSLIYLTLYRNDLGNEGYQRLVAFLEGNSKLIKLSIVENVVDDLSVARSFSDALKSHSTLERLIFKKCGLNIIPILGGILEACGRIKVLVIEKNNVGSEAVALIANFIRSNKNLETLRLKYNDITDNDTNLLAAALKKNTNLKRMDLQNNNITEEGEKILLKALYDPTSMDSIVDSNHTCRALTYDYEKPSVVAQRPLLEQEVLEWNKEHYVIQHKIRMKLVLALCGVDGELFDLSHLNDLPLQLMPRVLALIQWHTIGREKACRNMPDQLERDALSYSFTPLQLKKDALSRLFHTLRGWELPLLFENLKPKNKKKPAARKRKRKAPRRH